MLDNFAADNLKSRHAYNEVYTQYANEASFFWILRSISVNEPHNDINDILTLEKRINTQLDGLMTSMEIGWQACEEALELQEAGEVFTAMVVALRSHDSNKIKKAVDVGLTSPLALHGLVSAIGWISPDVANIWIEKFLNGKDLQHKYLGVAACSIRRIDPGDTLLEILKRSDCSQDVKLYSRALRLVGELRRQDCMPYTNIAMKSENDEIKFWATWSSVLLGQHVNSEHLKKYVFSSGALQDKAIQIAFRVLPIDTARDWVSELARDGKQTRTVIKAVGVLGDPHAVNWLINKMSDPLYAKLAGESLSYITGINLEKNNLTAEKPSDYLDIPNDDIADDIVGLDEDENLPYPNAVKVAEIWQKYGSKFIVGKRYFFGQVITVNYLTDIIKTGMQRQRHAAALELALHENGLPLVNTRIKVAS